MSNGENLRVLTTDQILGTNTRVAQIAVDETAAIMRAETQRRLKEQRKAYDAAIAVTGECVGIAMRAAADLRSLAVDDELATDVFESMQQSITEKVATLTGT